MRQNRCLKTFQYCAEASLLLLSKTLFARRVPVDREASIAGCGGVELRERGEYITKAIDKGDSEEIDSRGNCSNAMLTEGESRFCCSTLQWLPALESASSVISSAGDVLGAHKFCQDGLHAGSGWQGSRTDPPVPVSQCLSKRLDLRGQPTTQRTPKHTTLRPSSTHMWNQLHQSNLQCLFLLVNVLQNALSENCPQHKSPNRSQRGKISRVKKKPSYAPRSRPVDAENAHKCLSVVLNVSHTQFPIAKTNPIKGFLLLGPNCAMLRDYAKPLQKPMSPMLLFRWRTKSLPHASMAAKARTEARGFVQSKPVRKYRQRKIILHMRSPYPIS